MRDFLHFVAWFAAIASGAAVVAFTVWHLRDKYRPDNDDRWRKQ